MAATGLELDPRLERYAELAVRVGANLAEGQTLFVTCELDHAPLAQALARAGYAAGARYVDVLYRDPHVRHALIEFGPDEALEHSPAWMIDRWRHMDEEQSASIATTGSSEPELMADLDGTRVGRARMKELMEQAMQRMANRRINWSGVAYPNEGWANTVFGEPDVERLWEAVAFCTRLDEPDPVAAWNAHVDRLERRAEQLNALGVDQLRYRGPGTDLTVGMLDGARWMAARFETTWGSKYVPNMPTEEVFTTPDRRRTEGTVRSTRPLELSCQIVRGLAMRFEGGRIVEITADEDADVVRAQVETENGAFLGEVALVDGTSRVGQTGLTFSDTLYDENATCHIAYGFGLPEVMESTDVEGFNVASVHTDFMIGGPEVEIDAVTHDGRTIPILREDVWQLTD